MVWRILFFNQLPVVFYSVLCYFIEEMCGESRCFFAFLPPFSFVEQVNFPLLFFS